MKIHLFKHLCFQYENGRFISLIIQSFNMESMIEYYEQRPDMLPTMIDYFSWLFKIPYEFYRGYEEGLKYEVDKNG